MSQCLVPKSLRLLLNGCFVFSFAHVELQAF